MTIIRGNDEKFNNLMEEIAKKHERSIVFIDFLNYYINQNTTTDDFNTKDYTIEELTLFHEAYNEFKKLMKQLLKEYKWYDYIGEYYESFVLAGSKASSKGQFYTPREISDLLSRIVGDTDTLEWDGTTCYDPACGSARNILDFQSKHKCECIGEDLDESACKMAVVNMHCNKVKRGQVNWVDALTREYNDISWVIFPDGIIVTDTQEINIIQSIASVTSVLSYSLSGGGLQERFVINSIPDDINHEVPDDSHEEVDESKDTLDQFF